MLFLERGDDLGSYSFFGFMGGFGLKHEQGFLSTEIKHASNI